MRDLERFINRCILTDQDKIKLKNMINSEFMIFKHKLECSLVEESKIRWLK